MKNHIEIRAKKEDFIFLRDAAGFTESYNRLAHAMSYQETDWPTAAQLYRQALGSLLHDALQTLGEEVPGSLNDRIAVLQRRLPADFLPLDVIRSMHFLRMAANQYVHMSYESRDQEEDRVSFYLNALSVSSWLADLEERLPELEALEAERDAAKDGPLGVIDLDGYRTDPVTQPVRARSSHPWWPYALGGGLLAAVAFFCSVSRSCDD